MKRLLCCGILAGSVVAGYVHWRDNQQTYSVSIYSGGWSYGPSWRIGSAPFNIGYEVRRDVGFPNEWATNHNSPTFTDFEIGGCTITTRGDAYPWVRRMEYSAMAAVVAGFFLMLITPWQRKKSKG